MKDRTITQELNTSRIRSGLKNELREALTEVKLTKIKEISLFKCTNIHHQFFILGHWTDYKIVESQCLSPSEASRYNT